MARREIHNELDRENRNNHNENYEELYEKIFRINKIISDWEAYMTVQGEEWVI